MRIRTGQSVGHDVDGRAGDGHAFVDVAEGSLFDWDCMLVDEAWRDA